MSRGDVVPRPRRCAHARVRFAVKHRRALHIGKLAPELLDTKMGLLVCAALEREMPCEAKLAQTGRKRG